MKPDTGRKMVMVSMVVTSVAVGISYFKSKDRKAGQGFKTAWALGALYLILSIGADTIPEVAGPLALLIMLSCVLFPDKTLPTLLHVVPTPMPGYQDREGSGTDSPGTPATETPI